MIRSRPLRLSFVAGALALAAPAFAQDVQPADDPRLVTQVFDETRVYTVNGKVKVQTTLKFAPDEVIQNVAIGDSSAWQVQPNQAQTLLFVKPLATSARTNMTVVTNRRTYLFDLVASPRNAPLYVLQFRYPELEKAAAEAALAAAEQAKRDEANALELEAARDPFAVVDPARLNFEWAGEGDTALLPSRTYDDGDAVFLTWSPDAEIPAILGISPDGVEGPLNFTVRGNTIVLSDMPAQIILRKGDERATLVNVGPPRPRSADAGPDAPRGS